MIARLTVAFVLFLSFLTLLPSGASAQGDLAWPEWQWTNLGDPLNPKSPSPFPIYPDIFTAEFFYDATHGVAATAGSRGARIFYIADRHGRWLQARVPSGFTTVRMVRPIQGKLYAATDADVLVSADTGASWSYSGLGLVNSTDVYADATGKIRGLTAPMKVFARLDTLHCVAQGGGEVIVSSDGGVSWTHSLTMQDAVSSGVFADRCRNVLLCPNSWGTAWRSTDFGQTWKSIVTGSGPATEHLYGASVTPYILSEAGLVRSTDDGLTWKYISSVTAGWGGLGTHEPLFVWGPMGEHVVMPWTYQPFVKIVTQLWMTTTGGDDMLHSGSDMTDSNGAPLVQNDTFNIPLRITSHCNAQTIGLPFYSQVDSMYETVSILKDSLGDFALTGPTTLLCRRGREDTLHLAYNPHHLLSTVTLKIDNHWNCSDWSETRTIMVTSLPTAELLPPPPLAGNCKLARQAAYLKLDSCQTMIIDSVLIPTRLQQRLKFEHPLPDTILRGAGDSIYFTFDPRDTLTSIYDSVKFFAHYDGVDSALWWWDWRFYLSHDPPPYPPLSQFNRTLPITLLALPNVSLITRDSAILFRALKSCERVQDTFITVTNVGCTTDTILTVNIRGAGYTMQSVTTPIIVRPDSAVTLRVTFTAPTDSSERKGAIDLWVISGESQTLTIPLTGRGITSSAIFTMSAPKLDADSLSFCKQRRLLRDTLRNIGCDTIFFGQSVMGPDTTFSLLTPLTFIAPNDSAVVEVQFTTRIKGLHRDTIHVPYSLGHGAMQDTTIVLEGYVWAGESFLAASVEGLDVNQPLYACQSLDTTIYLINRAGCDTLYIDSVSFNNRSFTSASPTTYPLLLLPNDSVPISVHVTPDPNNVNSFIIAYMTVYSKATILPVMNVLMTLRAAFPDQLALRLTSDTTFGHAGDTVNYYVLLSGKPKATATISFALTYDDDILDSNLIAGPGLTLDSSVHGAKGIMTRYFTVPVSSASDTLARLRFVVVLADTGTTALTLSALHATANNGLPGDCIATLSQAGSTFTYTDHCAEDILHAFLANGTVLVESIRPNPARSEVEVVLNASNDTPNVETVLELRDVLGRKIPLTTIASSATRRSFDVSDIPEGVYYLEVRRGNTRATRELVIRR